MSTTNHKHFLLIYLFSQVARIMLLSSPKVLRDCDAFSCRLLVDDPAGFSPQQYYRPGVPRSLLVNIILTLAQEYVRNMGIRIYCAILWSHEPRMIT